MIRILKALLIFLFIIFDLMTSCSRLVEVQQIKRNWLKHEDRLIHVKSTLNTRNILHRAPSSRRQNLLKSLEVQMENKALLKKLTDRHHNKNDLSMCQNPPQIPKSTRKRYYQQHKIKIQNQGLYKRLRQTKPMIDTTSLRLQRIETQKYLNTISRFGYKNLKPTRTLLKFELINNQMKYQTGRRNLISEQSMMQHQSILQEGSKQKLFVYLSKYRRMNIDGEMVLLRIRKDFHEISIQILIGQKENHGGELQVTISLQMFKEKYGENVEELLKRLKYDRHSQNFYII